MDFIFEPPIEITDVPSMETYQSKLRIMPHLVFKRFIFLVLRCLILLNASLWTDATEFA